MYIKKNLKESLDIIIFISVDFESNGAKIENVL